KLPTSRGTTCATLSEETFPKEESAKEELSTSPTQPTIISYRGRTPPRTSFAENHGSLTAHRTGEATCNGYL
ncbi:hypothetical protein A2U01_0096257, partial [Trifolium medium]|nr:hypothetical protein [Trifolium medium]